MKHMQEMSKRKNESFIQMKGSENEKMVFLNDAKNTTKAFYEKDYDGELKAFHEQQKLIFHSRDQQPLRT